MDFEVIKTLSPWLLAGFSAGGSMVAFAVRGAFASKKEVEDLRKEQELLKAEVQGMPGHEELYELRLSIEGMRGDLKAISAALAPLQHINNLRLENDLKSKESI